jgi:predicted outer membrane repeat protein
MFLRARTRALGATLGALTLIVVACVTSPAASAAVATAPVVSKVVGKGTPGSCTQGALYNAVRTGGIITFDCGPDPVTITLTKTLRTCNTDNCKHAWQGGKALTVMTLDGGGKVTLSGGDTVGIFYSNSCEADLGWVTDRCDLQTTLQVTFKNITFTKGNATKTPAGLDSVGGGGGGGAIAMRGNRLSVVNSTFTSNRCIKAHSDAGGGAIRVVGMQKAASIKGSTFTGNHCANGGAISALGAGLILSGDTITSNRATGTGASSGKGGNGGGVYFDGTKQKVTITNSVIRLNKVTAGGSGVFYVSNTRTGTLTITGSTITANTGETFWTGSHHDLFYLGKTLTITSSTVA